MCDEFFSVYIYSACVTLLQTNGCWSDKLTVRGFETSDSMILAQRVAFVGSMELFLL